jgi:hypothetical protein
MPTEGSGLAWEAEAQAMLLERWQRYWSWLFYGLLLVATVIAVADVDSDRWRGVIVVLALALALWYRQAVPGSGDVAQGGGSHALVTWAVGAALWSSLLVLHGVFALLMFSAYHLACSTPLPVRRALPGIVAVSVTLIAAESARQGASTRSNSSSTAR